MEIQNSKPETGNGNQEIQASASTGLLTRCSSGSYEPVMKVGARELKNRLGHYLREVKFGETVYVADRGRIVAELKPSPPARRGDQEALRHLAAEGAITPGAGQREDVEPYPLVRVKKLAARMIIDDRR